MCITVATDDDFELVTGPDLRAGGKLGSCPGPPQLRGLHKKTVKNYYLRKHKNTL